LVADQNHVLPGKRIAEQFDDRLGELNDPGHRAEQA